jgi:hypothetical protein
MLIGKKASDEHQFICRFLLYPHEQTSELLKLTTLISKALFWLHNPPDCMSAHRVLVAISLPLTVFQLRWCVKYIT